MQGKTRPAKVLHELRPRKGLAGARSERTRNPFLIVFTDLDGTLLDNYSYSFLAARPALRALAKRHIPLVIVTSKTAREVWPILRRLRRREPFVVENGGAIVFPTRAFPFPIPGAESVRSGWTRLVLGVPRVLLIKALERAARLARVKVRGFSQMNASEVSRLTGLSRIESVRALERESDEPFTILEAGPRAWPRLRARIRRAGLEATRGSRFFHIHSKNDKGVAVRMLITLFRRALLQSGARSGFRIVTLGLGDSANDVSLLRAVDIAIVVAQPGGHYDPEVLDRAPHARRAVGRGPAGWNRAVLEVVRAISEQRSAGRPGT